MRIRAALLLGLMTAAVLSVGGAWRSLNRTGGVTVPEEVTARFVGREESAAFILRDSGGYVAVYAAENRREPLRLTPIETALLRRTDRELLKKGIPAESTPELLGLLEDLGS